MTLRGQCEFAAAALQRCDLRVVFAESCTAGLVSASLAAVPGISAHHCGSAVTYRNDTKARWLGISAAVLEDPGPVSKLVARQMAVGVLERTPEADVSASVTGHLGPDAPAEQDGLVYIALARRNRSTANVEVFRAVEIRLRCPDRLARQQEAAEQVMAVLCDELSEEL